VTLDETAQGAILAVTTTPLGYGTLTAFSGSSAQSLVVTNNGNIAANVQLAPGTSSFTATSGTAAANGGTFTSSVDFTPAQLGPIADSITISSSTVLCQPLPGAVPVSGTGKGTASQVAFAGLGRHHPGTTVTVVGGCAILPGGHVACWGDNTYGELGIGTVGTGVGGALGQAPPAVVPGLSGVTAIAAGGDFNCAVHAGLVSCWGNNTSRGGRVTGRLGFGGSQISVATEVPGVANAIDVTLGHNMGCALQSGGTAMCWGINGEGNLGRGGPITGQSFLAPGPVSGLSTATEIAAGGGGACALLMNSSVECWGGDGHDQLAGLGESSVPVVIPGFATDDGGTGPFATSIKAFGSRGNEGARCALQSDGTVSCWGSSGHGWTGQTTVTRGSQTVTPVPTISTATQLSVGYGFACVVLQSGGVTCWGRNDFGQLGNGGSTDSATPVAVAGITNAVQVSAGDSGACAVLATGSISCWGNNGITTSATPTTLPGF
jgi:alpha-tubulin suppressor-like RCC1 family protein